MAVRERELAESGGATALADADAADAADAGALRGVVTRELVVSAPTLAIMRLRNDVSSMGCAWPRCRGDDKDDVAVAAAAVEDDVSSTIDELLLARFEFAVRGAGPRASNPPPNDCKQRSKNVNNG